MRSRDVVLLIAIAAACTYGCAAAPTAPPDFLPKASEVPTSPFGAWIQVDCAAPEGKTVDIDGELLAVQNREVYVLIGDVVKSVPFEKVRQARVYYYNSQASAVAGIVFLGTLSTISNGVYLAITAPAWILVGSTATASRSRDSNIDLKNEDWSALIPYARFPQGLPPEFVPGKPIEAPIELPEEPVVVESPAPVALVATARERSEWGFAVGVGNARYENQGDLAGVLGLNVAKRWVTAGVRFTIGDRAPVEDGNPALAVDGDVFDLGVLVGVRGEFRGLQAAVRAGPAAWGLNFGEFEDIKAAFAAQGELFFYPTQTVGFGSIVTYNTNDIQDYYIVALGLAFGPR